MAAGREQSSVESLDIVIIGAGASALTAARSLSQQDQSAIKSVTIVEALSYIGGRIKSDDNFLPGHRVDVGAEYIHGKGTMLTDVVQDNEKEWQDLIGRSPLLEEIYIAAHADGGPQKQPTKDGNYGVYYLAEEDTLLRYDTDDKDFCALNEVLSNLKWGKDEAECDNMGKSRRRQSLGSYIEQNVPTPRRMSGLLEAGFGNTAGCNDLDKISLAGTIDFETYWEENEEEGDVRLHSRIGMVGIVDALVQSIEKDERFSIHLNWTANQIDWGENDDVIITSTNGDKIRANKVIITVPPLIITSSKIQFIPALPPWKVAAYDMVGMERAIKIILRFRKKLWPEKIPGMPIPEIWFREIKMDEEVKGEVAHLAVCFLTAKAADDLVEMLDVSIQEYEDSSSERQRTRAAARIAINQLARIFKIPMEDLEKNYISSIMFDWGNVETIMGGYVYPKVGIEKIHFSQMAQSIDNKLYFAGEATNTGACTTVQAAMETGLRVSNEILELNSLNIV